MCKSLKFIQAIKQKCYILYAKLLVNIMLEENGMSLHEIVLHKQFEDAGA